MAGYLDTPLEVADADVQHYRDNGWVRIDQLISRDDALAMRDRLLNVLESGVDLKPSETVRRSRGQEYVGAAQSRRQHLMYENPGDHDQLFHDVVYSRRIGSLLRALQGTDVVRYVRSVVLEKLSTNEGGASTNLHQDFPYLPIDRSGSATVWLALTDITPEMGPLQFVSGSHRAGSLGRDAQTGRVPDYIAQQYESNGWTLSEPRFLQAGDATVHADLMVHGAGANQTDTPRYGFAMTYMRGDVLYSGAPWRHTDPLGLTPNEPFEHERFAIIA